MKKSSSLQDQSGDFSVKTNPDLALNIYRIPQNKIVALFQRRTSTISWVGYLCELYSEFTIAWIRNVTNIKINKMFYSQIVTVKAVVFFKIIIIYLPTIILFYTPPEPKCFFRFVLSYVYQRLTDRCLTNYYLLIVCRFIPQNTL